MNRHILFNSVIKNPKSWCDSMNVDIMLDNYTKLKPLIDKMFFTTWPKHPQLFSILLSKHDFASLLINSMLMLNITNLHEILFTEYCEGDKEKLFELGIINSFEFDNNTATVIITGNNQDCFVNIVY